MKTKPLGTSGIDVPIICLGTMTFGTRNSQDEGFAQMDYALERGVNFIDTAEIYPFPQAPNKQGSTETIVGNWLKERGNRDKIILATKVGAAQSITTRDTGQPPVYTREKIREAVHGSLERLQTDYIDLYQVHWPERNSNFFGKRGYEHVEENPTPIEETLNALEELVKEGKIRHIGVSNESPWGIHKYLQLAAAGKPKIVSIQNQYSLANRTYEIGMAEMGMRENIGLLAYSVLNMGVLTGKYLGGAKPEGARFSNTDNSVNRYDPESAQEAVKAYVDLAKKHRIDPAEMAIAFAASREFVSSVIIGATDLTQLETAINGGELELSAEVLAGIEDIHARYPDVSH